MIADTMNEGNTDQLISKNGGEYKKDRRLSAAVADPKGRRNPAKSIFAGITHTPHAVV